LLKPFCEYQQEMDMSLEQRNSLGLAQLEEARAELEAVEQMYKELKAKARDHMYEAILQIGRETADTPERNNIIAELYWLHRDIPSTWIGNAFHIREYDVRMTAQGYASVSRICHECEQEFKAVLKSRSDYAPFICQPCQQAREARWKSSQAQQKVRLEELRTMPYQEYLKTEEWQEKRQERLRVVKYRCQICNAGNTTLDVHHRTYERRGNEYARDLIVLCRNCHALFHDKLPTE
jgi:5-methylcytosine-specific restriction endonuclease McrA